MIIVIGIILVFLGVIGINKSLRIKKDGVKVTATVVEVKRSPGYRNRYDNVFFSFQTRNGQQVTARDDAALNEYRVGDRVEIVYLQSRPTKIYTAFSDKSGYMVLIIGIVLLLFQLIRSGVIELP